jgi:hypothetical protein
VGRLLAQTRYQELPAALSEASAAVRALTEVESYAQLYCAFASASSGRVAESRELLDALPRDWLATRSDPGALVWLAGAAAVSGSHELIERTLQRLAPLAERCGSGGLVELAWYGPHAAYIARLHAACDRLDEAERWFENAHERLVAIDATPHVARVTCELAEVLVRRGRSADFERARSLFASALEIAERLDMPGLMVRIREHNGFVSGSARGFALRREGDVWSIEHPGGVIRLKHTRGLSMLATLVEREREDIHVTELMGAPDGVDGGDAGEILDRKAKQAYRARLESLHEQLREAEDRNDIGRANRVRAELDVLTQQLARAVGLGGQDRRVGAATERARIAVRQRLRDAIRKIVEHAPALETYLDSAIKTGTFCSYHPPTG